MSFDLPVVELLCLFCRVLTVWYCQLFVSDSWKLSDVLADGCADDARPGNTQEGRDLKVSPDKTQFNQGRLIFLDDVVHAIAFSPCGKLLAVGGDVELRHKHTLSRLVTILSLSCLWE